MPTLTLEGDISEDLNGYEEDYIVSELHGDFIPDTVHPDGSVTGFLRTENVRVMPAYAGLSGDESEAVWMPVREFEGLHGGFALAKMFKGFKMPKIKLPKMPKIPKVKIKMPKFKAPKFKMPKFKAPNFKMPNIKLPNFKMPNLGKLGDAAMDMLSQGQAMPGGEEQPEEQAEEMSDESAEDFNDDSDINNEIDAESEFDSGELGFLPALMAAAPMISTALPMVTGALSSFSGGSASGGMGMIGNLLSSFGGQKAGSAVNAVASSNIGSFADQMLKQKLAAEQKKRLQQAQQKQMILQALNRQKQQTALANKKLQAQKAQTQKLQASTKPARPVIIKQTARPRIETDQPAPYTPTANTDKKLFENPVVMVGGALTVLGVLYIMTNNTNKRKR